MSAEVTNGLAVVGPEAARSAAPAPDGLPCLNSNNSNEDSTQQAVIAGGSQLSPYQRKALFALTENIVKFINDVGLERVAFLTLTFDHKVFGLDEASACFNRLNVRVLKEFFGGWVRVIEEHKDGSWHYHLLVEMPCDIRTGFNFAAFEASKKKYLQGGRSAQYYRLLHAAAGPNHPLPKIWNELRQRLKGYHFGRFELVPIRTNKEGISKYLAKYLTKGLTAKRKDGRRIRLTAISRKVKRAVNMPFAWVSPGARHWRNKVSMMAEHFGCHDLDDISQLFGPRWAFHLKELIPQLILPDMREGQEYIIQWLNFGDRVAGTLLYEVAQAQPWRHQIMLLQADDREDWPMAVEQESDSCQGFLAPRLANESNFWNSHVFPAMAFKLSLRKRHHYSRDAA